MKTAAAERTCPACGEPISSPRATAIWCSAPCRAWVSSLGGPAGAARWCEEMANSWDEAYGPWDPNPEYRRTARELRARARRLRKLGRARSNRGTRLLTAAARGNP